MIPYLRAGLLPFVIVLSLILAMIHGSAGGKAAAFSIPANVSVGVARSMGLSSNLSTGILFGTLNPNTNDNNAVFNYGDGNGTGSTYYLLTTGSSTPTDFCINDNTHLTTSSGGITMGNGNYTFNDSLIPDAPSLPGTAIAMGYQKLSQQGVAQNVSVYLRFWLDIPASQPAGAYNNTLTFKAIASGTDC